MPFVLVMIGLCVALAKDLRTDPLMLRAIAREAVEAAVIGASPTTVTTSLWSSAGNGTGDSVSEEPEKDSPPH